MSLAESILRGDVRSLARAATLLEASAASGADLIRQLFPLTGRALTIGITGAPGVGKSTLVNSLISQFRSQSLSVGVIAVDPTSPFSQGALLGDRIRMLSHHSDPHVFIRSMATRGRLGGLAAATLNLVLLMDAAGHQIVLVETVGVGQDEIDIMHVADITLVVLAPGAGDDIQALKAGILEIADVVVVNKADLAGADRLRDQLLEAQMLGPIQTPVLLTSTQTPESIASLLTHIQRLSAAKKSERASVDVWRRRLRLQLRDDLLSTLSEGALRTQAELVSFKKEDPLTAIATLKTQLLGQTNKPI